ncbi:MAG: NAD-dependent epimerase/dehydratase family protein [Gemmatimonadales bacterium]
MKTALLAGASGLVGSRLLRLVLDDPGYERVTALVRRGLPLQHKKLVQREIDFEMLAELGNVPRADDVFCCLGTTMKQAGSREAFYRVDCTYVHELARLAAAQRARQFLLVSALGANPRSRIFYNRVKGEVEEAVKRIAFESIHIFRPSFLTGPRAERRLGERIAIPLFRALSPLMIGPLRRSRPIPAETVARAIVRVARKAQRGVHVYPSDQIAALGDAERA